jgi:ferrochelatase
LTPSTPEKLEALAVEGHEAVLIIPVAFVTDHIETSYELDIEVREEAMAAGIRHFEVMPALNCHPLFIEALAEATIAQLELPYPPVRMSNGIAPAYPLRPLDKMPRFHPSERCTRCHQCEHIAEARRWTVEDEVAKPLRHRPQQQA